MGRLPLLRRDERHSLPQPPAGELRWRDLVWRDLLYRDLARPRRCCGDQILIGRGGRRGISPGQDRLGADRLHIGHGGIGFFLPTVGLQEAIGLREGLLRLADLEQRECRHRARRLRGRLIGIVFGDLRIRRGGIAPSLAIRNLPERVGPVEREPGHQTSHLALGPAAAGTEFRQRLLGDLRRAGGLFRVDLEEREPMRCLGGFRHVGRGERAEPRAGFVAFSGLRIGDTGGEPCPACPRGLGETFDEAAVCLCRAGPVFPVPPRHRQAFDRIGGAASLAVDHGGEDLLRLGGVATCRGQISSPDCHVVGEGMRGKSLGKPFQCGSRFVARAGLGLAHTECIEHLREPRRLLVLAEEPLPGGDRLVALTRLPERLTEKEESVGRLRLPRTLLQKFLEAAGCDGKSLRRWLRLGVIEGTTAEFPAGQRHRGGIGLARDHLPERFSGLLSLAVLELADTEIGAALVGQWVCWVGLDECLPFLGREVPGLAVLQCSCRRIGRPGGVARTACVFGAEPCCGRQQGRRHHQTDASRDAGCRACADHRRVRRRQSKGLSSHGTVNVPVWLRQVTGKNGRSCGPLPPSCYPL